MQDYLPTNVGSMTRTQVQDEVKEARDMLKAEGIPTWMDSESTRTAVLDITLSRTTHSAACLRGSRWRNADRYLRFVRFLSTSALMFSLELAVPLLTELPWACPNVC